MPIYTSTFDPLLPGGDTPHRITFFDVSATISHMRLPFLKTQRWRQSRSLQQRLLQHWFIVVGLTPGTGTPTVPHSKQRRQLFCMACNSAQTHAPQGSKGYSASHRQGPCNLWLKGPLVQSETVLVDHAETQLRRHGNSDPSHHHRLKGLHRLRLQSQLHLGQRDQQPRLLRLDSLHHPPNHNLATSSIQPQMRTSHGMRIHLPHSDNVLQSNKCRRIRMRWWIISHSTTASEPKAHRSVKASLSQ